MIERIERQTDPERALRDLGLQPSAWTAGALAHFPEHSHPRPKRLYVARGSISFNGEELNAPDGIRITAGFTHSADAGPDGVACVEAFE
jgi:hypothetical protein